MTYKTSSQARQFTFTSKQLEEKRIEAYHNASSSFAVSLSPEDHLRYVNYYCNKLLEASYKLNFNRHQRYTALALMQRVYINRTIWEIPPQLAMISCLFLVTKFIRPQSIHGLLGSLGFGSDFDEKFQPEKQMSKVEIGVLTALDFKLKIYLPFHQVEALCHNQPFREKSEEAQRVLFDILKTDALLLFPPSQIALAAVSKVVGHEEALAALGDVQVPDGIDLTRNIDEILQLQADAMNVEEIQQVESNLGPEFAVFQVIEREKKKEAQFDKPSSMLPP